MQIGAFVREMGTTADTVRYYMELSLLGPELKGNRYSFGEKEVRDFQAIAQLKQWGFAVKEIQCLFRHKAQSGCGTAGCSASPVTYCRNVCMPSTSVLRSWAGSGKGFWRIWLRWRRCWGGFIFDN